MTCKGGWASGKGLQQREAASFSWKQWICTESRYGVIYLKISFTWHSSNSLWGILGIPEEDRMFSRRAGLRMERLSEKHGLHPQEDAEDKETCRGPATRRQTTGPQQMKLLLTWAVSLALVQGEQRQECSVHCRAASHNHEILRPALPSQKHERHSAREEVTVPHPTEFLFCLHLPSLSCRALHP